MRPESVAASWADMGAIRSESTGLVRSTTTRLSSVVTSMSSVPGRKAEFTAFRSRLLGPLSNRSTVVLAKLEEGSIGTRTWSATRPFHAESRK